jgi:hypothetical protein
MPIKMLEQQRRTYEVGRIRIGVQVPVANKAGRTRPAKLDTLRFTSRDEHAIRAVAELYGGEVRQWMDAPTDDQWEVITIVREIGVIVPPGPQSVSQWMEMWSGGGCIRRCDGETEQHTGRPCMCPSDPIERAELAQQGKACKPTTRTSLVLPDVPGLGVWRLDSHGWNAAHEFGGTAEFLAAVREAGAWVPAVLRLEKRKVVSGGKTKEFAVPVLMLRHTVREMLEAPRTGRIELPAPPPRALAIEAAKPQQAALEAAPHPGPARDLPPTSSQEMAARVETCDDLAYLRSKLARFAAGKRWMEDFVESRYAPEEGELIELREVFRGRENELEGVRRG